MPPWTPRKSFSFVDLFQFSSVYFIKNMGLFQDKNFNEVEKNKKVEVKVEVEEKKSEAKWMKSKLDNFFKSFYY